MCTQPVVPVQLMWLCVAVQSQQKCVDPVNVTEQSATVVADDAQSRHMMCRLHRITTVEAVMHQSTIILLSLVDCLSCMQSLAIGPGLCSGPLVLSQ